MVDDRNMQLLKEIFVFIVLCVGGILWTAGMLLRVVALVLGPFVMFGCFVMFIGLKLGEFVAAD